MLLTALLVRRDFCARMESRIKLDNFSLSEAGHEGCETAHDGVFGNQTIVFEWFEEV